MPRRGPARGSQEAPHLGVRRRKTVRARVRSDIRQTKRARISNQLAEHSPTPGKRADLVPGLLVYPGVEEALEPALVLVHDPQCRITGAGQVAGGIEHPVKQRLKVELGNNRPPNLQELLEALVREPRFVQGLDLSLQAGRPRRSMYVIGSRKLRLR